MKSRKPSRKRQGSGIGRKIGLVLLTLLVVGMTTAAICIIAFAAYINNYVKPNSALDVETLAMQRNSVIYYENSEGKQTVLEELRSEENRIWVDIEDTPEHLKDAFVAIEDQRFYEHNGVDWKRTAGAAIHWLIPSGSGYGGSTITQQMVKNYTDDNDYSVTRKITEIVRAQSIEDQMLKICEGDRQESKTRILEMYMNLIYFGESAYGVQTASHAYFNKDVSELSTAECALIAGLTQSPASYNPFNHPEAAKERQQNVLYKMHEQGYLTDAEYEEAKAEELKYEKAPVTEEDKKPYSYFTDMVIEDVISDLRKKYDYSYDYAKAMCNGGGLSIYATVDMDIQKIMEDVYANNSNFPSISQGDQLPQSAMMVMDPKTGYIVGVVGGRGEKTESLVLNRATQSLRSPGSSLKPLSVYAPATDAGIITPYSVYQDAPVMQLNGRGWPYNESRTYSYAATTVRVGVAKSLNTIAAGVLQDLTPEASFEFMSEKLHFTTLDALDMDYSPLALGGMTNGVSVREMTQAYGALANYGNYNSAKSYTQVVDSDGNVILDHTKDATTQIFEHPESTPYYVNDMLTNAVNNGTGTLAKVLGIETAGKTGTTSDNKDRWFAGYTPYYVGVTWFGYDKEYGLPNLYPNPAVRLWKAVMSRVHEDLPNKQFEDGGKSVWRSYCTKTGLLPNWSCTRGYGEFWGDSAPTEYCQTIHYVPKPVAPSDSDSDDDDDEDTDTGDTENTGDTEDGGDTENTGDTGTTGDGDTE